MTYVPPVTTSSSPSRQPGDVTLGSYDAAAHLYLMHSAPPGPAVLAYLDEVARLVGDGTVLELGSGPVLAVTLKGGRPAWTEAKLDCPRHFTYWREPAVHAALLATGWQVLSLEHVAGRVEPWLFVLARTASAPGEPPRRPRRRSAALLNGFEGLFCDVWGPTRSSLAAAP